MRDIWLKLLKGRVNVNHPAKTILNVVLLTGTIVSCGVAEAKPRLYWELREVREPAKAKPSMKSKARAIFNAELKKHPEVVTQLDPRPSGDELAKTLKRRKLTGYAMVLRITKIGHSMNPPAPGKVYKVLMVEVNVAIDAEKIPSGQMALAGQGSAQVGTEVSRFKEKERIQLTIEALTEAIGQAVKRSVGKLTGKKKRRRRSRGRRRRAR
jgi:hypothetical protein